MRISDWSSDVCSSDLANQRPFMLASSVRAPHNEAIAAASAHAIRSGVQMTSHTELETPDPGPGAGQVLPVLPLRDVVVFPHMVIPLFVGREKSIHALGLAMGGDRKSPRLNSSHSCAH